MLHQLSAFRIVDQYPATRAGKPRLLSRLFFGSGILPPNQMLPLWSDEFLARFAREVRLRLRPVLEPLPGDIVRSRDRGFTEQQFATHVRSRSIHQLVDLRTFLASASNVTELLHFGDYDDSSSRTGTLRVSSSSAHRSERIAIRPHHKLWRSTRRTAASLRDHLLQVTAI